MPFLVHLREYAGYAAGLLTTIAFVPQVLKTIRERETRDISLGMYLLFCSGVTLWLIYGFLISSIPLLISNFVTLMLASTILLWKLKNGR